MCRFISIAVKEENQAKLIFTGYSLWSNQNKSFGREVPNDFEKLWVTDAYCSCAYYTDPFDPEMEAEKLRKKLSKPKYKKKGWTAERVEREVEKILTKKSNAGGLSEPLYDNLRKYVSEVGSCYFHVGWYTGDQSKQRININERLSLNMASGSILASEINEDVLYTFK